MCSQCVCVCVTHCLNCVCDGVNECVYVSNSVSECVCVRMHTCTRGEGRPI